MEESAGEEGGESALFFSPRGFTLMTAALILTFSYSRFLNKIRFTISMRIQQAPRLPIKINQTPNPEASAA